LLRATLLEAIAKRVRLGQYLEREAEIAALDLGNPICIVAPFRTGTTFLQHLLAQDPDCRWPRPWETAYAPPAEPSLRGDPDYFRADGRIPVLERALAGLYRRSPDLAWLHPVGAHWPEECFGLLETSLLSHSFMFYGDLQDYLDWLGQRPEAAWRVAYRRYADQLRLLHWWQPGRRWLLKNPLHMWNLPALLECLPGARVIHLHRPAAASVASLCRLLEAHQRLYLKQVDVRQVGRLARDYVRATSQRAAAARESLPQEAFLELEYGELMADPMNCVRRIRAWSGAGLSAAAEQRMRAWLASREGQPIPPTGSRPGTDLDGYGLDAGTLAHDMAAYDDLARGRPAALDRRTPLPDITGRQL
jgi:hypothetical protein